MTQPPIYIISLPDSHERRKNMAAQLNALGLSYEFFDAIDARGTKVTDCLDYDSDKRRRYFGRDLTGGEIGCLLSHKALYQKMLDENIEAAVIFEDDCIISEQFGAVLDELMGKTHLFDCIRFLGSDKVMKRGGRKVLELTGGHWLVRMPTAPGGAHATLMTLKGVKKLMPHLSPTPYPIDTVLGRCWETGLNAYTIIPGLALHNEELESAIGDKRFQKIIELEGVDKTLYPLTRTWFKLNEGLGKRWFFYSTYFRDKSSLRA